MEILVSFFASFTPTQIGSIIFILLAFGILLVVWAYLNLKGDEKNLHRTRSELGNLLSQKEISNSQSSGVVVLPYRLSDKLEEQFLKFLEPYKKYLKIFNLNTTSLVWSRVRSLEQIHENAGRFDRNSMSEVTRSKLRAQTASLRYIAGILILIGLFGTLCGLTGAVSGLGQAVEQTKEQKFETSEQVDRFVDDLRVQLFYTLQGMRTAFVASLFGVFSTILLTAMVAGINKKQLNFLAKLEEFTTNNLLPLYLPKSEATSLQKIADNFDVNARQLEKVFNKIQADIGQKDLILSQVGALSKLFSEFLSANQNRDDDIYHQLGDSIKKLSEVVANSHVAFEVTKTAIDELKAAMQQITQSEVETRENYYKELDNSFKKHNNELSAIFGKIQQALLGQYAKTKESSDTLVNSSIAISETLKSLITIEQENKNLFLNLKQELIAKERFDEIKNQISVHTETLQKLVDEQGLLGMLKGNIASQLAILLNAFGTNGKDSGQVTNLLREIGKHLQETTRNNRDMISSFARMQNEFFSEFKKSPKGTPVKFSGKDSERLTEVLGALAESLNDYIYLQESRRISNRISSFFSSIFHGIHNLFRFLKRNLIGHRRHRYEEYYDEMDTSEKIAKDAPKKAKTNSVENAKPEVGEKEINTDVKDEQKVD